MSTTKQSTLLSVSWINNDQYICVCQGTNQNSVGFQILLVKLKLRFLLGEMKMDPNFDFYWEKLSSWIITEMDSSDETDFYWQNKYLSSWNQCQRRENEQTIFLFNKVTILIPPAIKFNFYWKKVKWAEFWFEPRHVYYILIWFKFHSNWQIKMITLIFWRLCFFTH